MNRVEWSVIIFATWLFAEAVWWAILGEWTATVDEGITVAAALLIAILTCPDRRLRSESKEGQSDAD